MLKYDVGPFKRPAGLLRQLPPAKRITPKSDFLRAVERRVQENSRATTHRS